MLIALISDVHGNLPALEAAVADAQARGADRIACCGDLTGYGPFPDEVCRFMEDERVPALLGNYNRKVIDVVRKGNALAEGMKSKKREILLWTVEQLGKRGRRYLAALPERLELRIPAGGHTLLAVHGSAVSADDTIYPSVTPAGLAGKLGRDCPAILVCGHTHIPFARRVGGILVVNCGSAGQPVDGDPRPAYALVHAEKAAPPRGRIVRYDYDLERTLHALEKSSLPKGLQKDLARGNKRRFAE